MEISLIKPVESVIGNRARTVKREDKPRQDYEGPKMVIVRDGDPDGEQVLNGEINTNYELYSANGNVRPLVPGKRII